MLRELRLGSGIVGLRLPCYLWLLRTLAGAREHTAALFAAVTSLPPVSHDSSSMAAHGKLAMLCCHVRGC